MELEERPWIKMEDGREQTEGRSANVGPVFRVVCVVSFRGRFGMYKVMYKIQSK